MNVRDSDAEHPANLRLALAFNPQIANLPLALRVPVKGAQVVDGLGHASAAGNSSTARRARRGRWQAFQGGAVILRPGDQMGLLSLRRPSSLFARNIPLGCSVGMMGWRVEERDALSVPDPLTGDSVFRIHGTNQPETIGHAVSSGCFRLDNADVIDLYDRVQVGAKVLVRQSAHVS